MATPRRTHRCRSSLPLLLSLALVLPLVLLGAPAALAQQQPTGSVAGTVTNDQGKGVGFAQVVIEGTQLGTITDASGAYRIANVPTGSQVVAAMLIGNRTARATITVVADQTVTQDLVMAPDPLGMETLVVTGTSTPTEQLESSTAITVISDKDIELDQPRSNADLLKNVPGYYVESSGGNVNNNLFVRGLPADGSYRYVVMLEDGMMLFDPNDLFFLGADNLFRIDQNIQRVEAIRGGNSALFGSNAPGGLVNMISKTGGPGFGGTFRIQAGTDGYNRYDANVNGPIAEDWQFSLGGFYRFDDGIRDPGFPAARGGQIRANITRFFDRGYVRVSGKYLNDRNVFYLPVPVMTEQANETSPQGADVIEVTSDFAPGFPKDGTLTTVQGDQTQVPLPLNNGTFAMPLSNGVAALTGSWFAADFKFDFPDEWSIQNTMRVMNISHQNNAMPPGQATPVGEVEQGLIDETNDILVDMGLTPTATTARFTFVDSATAFNTANGLVQNATLWHVERPVSNFSNQFVVRKLAQSGESSHNITFGGYFGHYEADNLWMFNNLYTNIQNAPRLLNAVVLDAAGDTLRQVTDNGFSQYLGLYVNATGNATLYSFFAGDEWQINEKWRVDVGARIEHDDYEQNVENTSTFSVGTCAFVAGCSATEDESYGDGTFTRRTVDFTEWAASIGLNYSLNRTNALYVRGSKGYKMPLIDQYLFEQFPDTAETIWQVEGGWKVSSGQVGAAVVGYWTQLEDFPSQDVRIVNGNPEFVTALGGQARTIGIEVEGAWAPIPSVQVNGLFTFQDHEYINFTQDDVNLDGNWVRRIPKMFWKLGGLWSGYNFTVGADWYWYGKRYSNNANTVKLPQFGYVNALISYAIPNQGFTITAGVTNLLDGAGLTEGDPRFDEQGAPTGLGNARPILPRRFTAGIGYAF
jgi:iron complex outermembrane receptor protein